MPDTVTVLEAFMESIDQKIGSPPPGPERNRRLRVELAAMRDRAKGSARAFLQSMLDNIPDAAGGPS